MRTRTAQPAAVLGLVVALALAVGAVLYLVRGDGGQTTDGTNAAGAQPGAPRAGPLSWRPPRLDHPQTIDVTNAKRELVLAAGRDYVVRMPPQPLTASGGLAISGGRNVVLMGGHISIPRQGPHPDPNSRRGLFLKGQTGTVHVEGLLIDGPDLGEGIDLDEPKGAIVQLENLRIEKITARDKAHFTDIHPDLLQTWAGPRELRIDRLTGTTTYQGLFLQPQQFGTPPPRLFTIRNVNIRGLRTSGYLLWRNTSFPVKLENVRLQPLQGRQRWKLVWPGGWRPSGVRAAGGRRDFVPAGTAGTGYKSPGYAPAP